MSRSYSLFNIISISNEESAALKEAEQKQDIKNSLKRRKTLFEIKGYYVNVQKRHLYGNNSR